MTNKLCFAANSIIGSISSGRPKSDTAIIAFVFSVIFCSIVVASKFQLSGFMSAKTGVAPCDRYQRIHNDCKTWAE